MKILINECYDGQKMKKYHKKLNEIKRLRISPDSFLHLFVCLLPVKEKSLKNHPFIRLFYFCFWIKANEISTNYSDIGRGDDNVHLSQIEMAPSSQNLSAESDYTFQDAEPVGCVSFCSLKKMDKDGYFNYSVTIFVKMSTQVSIQIVGNPEASIYK